jgi:very-short-patch-repair endonuclease
MTRRLQINAKTHADDTILELAARQRGVVSRRQLIQAGVSSDKVDGRVRAKRLHALYRGVYRVGPVVAQYAHEMAAVLACDGLAVVSHRSSAELWQLPPQRRSAGPVTVILAHSDHGRRPNIEAHRVRALPVDEVTKLERIPITTPARTLLDIAGAVSCRELERAVAEAFARGLANESAITTLMSRHPRRPGARVLRALLGAEQPALTRSEAEERFLSLIRKARLPAPEVNVSIGDYQVDFFWRVERFVVEIDGFAFHSSVDRFESDRRRDAVLAAAGLRVMRVTWRQMQGEPEAMLVRLGQALIRTNEP